MGVFEEFLDICELHPNSSGRCKKSSVEKFLEVGCKDIYDDQDRDEINKVGDDGYHYFYKEYKKVLSEKYNLSIDWDWATQVKNCIGFYCSSKIYGCLPVFTLGDIIDHAEQEGHDREAFDKYYTGER